MTRKHFITIAATIANSPNFRSHAARERFAREMARELHAFNSGFDTDRFVRAATRR